jgi:hypothetical protein
VAQQRQPRVSRGSDLLKKKPTRSWIWMSCRSILPEAGSTENS